MKGERCGAQTRGDGHPCQRWALRGQKRCRLHGGASPQARRRADERLQLEEARAAVERHGADPVTDPFAALAALAGEMTAVKNELRARKGTPGADAAYERALDRLGRILPDMARVGVQAKQLEAEMERWVGRQAGAAVTLAFGLAADLGADVADPAVQAAVDARLVQFGSDSGAPVHDPRRLTRR